jgi:tetratricopeptide (TPR) repeat protein
LVAEKLPLFLLAAAFSAVTAHLTLSAERAVAVLPLRVRMAMAPVSAVTYLGQMFYPHNLSAHYPYSEDGPPAWQVVAACALLLAISAGVLAVCRSRPYLLVGWLWYLVTLLPVIGLVPGGNQLMADRYSYITHIGLYVALLWAAADLSASWPQRGRLGAAVSALVLVGLTTCAWRQTSYWRDSETLWRHALSCTSDNAIAHEHLGTALEQLARLAQEKNDYPLARDRIAEAKEHYQQALTIMPRSLPALCDLGNLLNEEGKVDEAIGLYQRAIAINSKLAAAHYNLGNALLHKGRVDDAIASYERALEFAPNFVQAHNNLANLLGEKGRTDEALDHYRQAIEASPGYAETYNNLGNALRRQGKIAEALTNYHRTLEIDPKHAGAYTSLGDVSRQNGQLDTAATYYQQALQADPRCLVACNNLGDILIRQGKIDEAIAVYRRAVEIAPQGAIIWYNLGVCLGQKGRLDETMVCYQKALGLASARNDKALADVIRAQIRLQQSVAPAGNAR